MMERAAIYRNARKGLNPLSSDQMMAQRKQEAEGGCGVVGLMSSVPVRGRHLHVPSLQMQNRGNGKGGGIAALGLVADEVGVSERILREDYIFQIAYLDPGARTDVENDWIFRNFEVDHMNEISTLDDHRDAGLEVRPPRIVRYFTRVREDALQEFSDLRQLNLLHREEIEDEYVYQHSYRLNQAFYASLGEKRAFVMSHAKDLLVFKLVGFAEQVIEYYLLENLHAHGWIAHQRYPTKGRVWHPGGAHPFIGMHEALVHNGDFANYYGVCEYLKQHAIYPLFLTDTEVSVLLFDLLSRSFEYPLEWVIESMAPTTERDFLQLPADRQEIYKSLQMAHLNGSPDGPWFFIIARNDTRKKQFQLLGITDTSMLRPQVFALQNGEVRIGLIASEKQAIDAVLESLASEDSRVCPVADLYWNARGGSHTDGGAFRFSVDYADGRHLSATNKFEEPVGLPADAHSPRPSRLPELPESLSDLTRMLDFRINADAVPNKWLTAAVSQKINEVLDRSAHTRVAFDQRNALPPAMNPTDPLVIDAKGFSMEGSDSLAIAITQAYRQGWREIIVYRCRGQRFIGCGLHENSAGLRLHIYGSSGDYLSSGVDGAEVYVHGNAQDQVGQIFHRGKLVVYGDVGQTFFYGAKGGEAYVMGNAAGRPLINAVGSPRVVINGTCLDYLAESFMAGDPLRGGGFVILNSLRRSDAAGFQDLPSPYPGSNLFSLASGGAIYVRDPHHVLEEDQLNGGEFQPLTAEDWHLILPYLEENERLFGISVKLDLLRGKSAYETYIKIRPASNEALK